MHVARGFGRQIQFVNHFNNQFQQRLTFGTYQKSIAHRVDAHGKFAFEGEVDIATVLAVVAVDQPAALSLPA